MSFRVVYSGGGDLDKLGLLQTVESVQSVDRVETIRTVDRVESIGPEHIFPIEPDPYIKGLRLEVDQDDPFQEFTYTLPESMVLVSIAIHASGYADGDYWEAFYNTGAGERKFVETCYTKEVPETFPMVGFLGGKRLAQLSTVRIRFVNATGTYKTVWFTLRFLRQE